MSERFDAVVERQEKLGDVVMEEGFTGNTRMLGSSNLSEGQIILIPENFKVYKNAQLSNDERTVSYTIAKLLNEKKEEIGGVLVYPSAFNRTVFIYEKDEDGNPRSTGRTDYPKGAPVDDFNGQTTIQEAMKAIANKPIRVSGSRDLTTRQFDDKTKLTTQRVYDFTYVA